MPIYEYRCDDCQRKVSIYVRDSSTSPKCPSCGSGCLSRLFSTFAVRGTHKEIYEDILDDKRLVDGLMRDDPQALAEWSRRMSRGMDEQPAPEYEEMLDRMDHGEMPEEFTKGSELPVEG
jgi:putative FmdB family regulatory protein